MSERDGDTGGPPGGEPAGGPVDRRRGRLTLLGTGTCQLEADRMASSVLLELGGLRVVFDFGRGISLRLLGLGLRQDDVEHVVLSHFHPDHFSDLVPYLHAASYSRIDPRSRPLHVWGPPGVEAQIDRLRALPGHGALINEERYELRVHELEGDGFEIDDQAFQTAELPPAGNRGLKTTWNGHTCALTGDSDYHDAEVEFLAGVDLAVVDAGHPEEDQLVELTVRAAPGRLVCSHLYRPLDEAALQARAEKAGFQGRLQVGRDLMQFAL